MNTLKCQLGSPIQQFHIDSTVWSKDMKFFSRCNSGGLWEPKSEHNIFIDIKE